MGRKTTLAAAIVAAGLAGWSGPVLSAPPLRCPQRIAFISSDPVSVVQAARLKAVYSAIGCPDVVFTDMPGRRGIAAFNRNDVDGELLRLRVVEPDYTRPFAHTRVPLMRVEGRLWARAAADHAGPETGGYGYVLGVVWQEEVARVTAGIAYHGQAALYRAYETGQIDRFLGEDSSVAMAVRDGRLSARPPYAGPALLSSQLYHYLGREFAGTIAALDAALDAARARPAEGGR